MACTVADIAAAMERLAPTSLAEAGDNVGLLAGASARSVDTVLIALDIDENVLSAAKQIGAQIVVTHHPFIYRPIAAVSDLSHTGRLAIMAIEATIALFAAHTNLDRAAGGVNDALCQAVGLLNPVQASAGSIGRIASVDCMMQLDAFAGQVKSALGAPAVRVTGDRSKPVKRIYVISGAGRHYIADAAAAGADCMLTGEIGYHDGQDALGFGLGVVEAGHYHSEAPVLSRIESHLQSESQRLQYTVRTVIYDSPTCPFHYIC